MTTGLALIAAERQRQVSEEGYTSEHDDEHRNAALAWAAVCYAAPETVYRMEVHSNSVGRDEGEVAWWEPWPADWARPDQSLAVDPEQRKEERTRELAKAGALIAAEIDRIQRLLPDERI